VNRKWRNWYQNEVDEETKGADSRHKVKQNEKSDQFLISDEGGRARITTDEERVLRGR